MLSTANLNLEIVEKVSETNLMVKLKIINLGLTSVESSFTSDPGSV